MKSQKYVFFVSGLVFDQGQTVPHLICCLALPFSFDLNCDVCSLCDNILWKDCISFSVSMTHTLAVAEGVAWLADADRLVILNSAGTFAAQDSATGVCINISN